MSDHTPITGNLRLAMVQWGWADGREVTITDLQPSIDAEPFLTIRGGRFGELCDAIDAVHANLERENAELRDELRRIKKDGDDGGVKPPKGADDAPIRIDDAMVLQHEAKEKPYVVQSLTWDGEDWYFTCDEGLFNVCGWEHYHAPTVEDVLREFADGIKDQNADFAELAITEYAAKLREVMAE